MFLKKLSSIVIGFGMLVQMLVAPTALADFLPAAAYANDTVAGFATLLKSSLLAPEQNIIFVVEKPDSSVVQIPAVTDLEGIAQAELFGHQTKLAGQYKVALVYPGSSSSSPQSSFQIYADSVSPTQSTLQLSESIVDADGVSKSFVTVTLYDAYRNPIPEHVVKLISSRSEDSIEILHGGVSDEMGRAHFKLTSAYPGLSVLTALDSTLNVILEDRSEVVFQTPVAAPAIGGNLLQSNLFGADLLSQGADAVLPGPVDHFEIMGLPSSVSVNTDLDLTVIAKDNNGNVAKNYTGTVLFSIPDDENAVLPSNGQYTFKESDQGQFTFNLALRFSAFGKQIVQVFDKNNWDVMGEFEVDVLPQESINPNAVSSNLSIKSPADGVTLGNSFVILTGQGDSNINLKVFDNDIKIGDSETDSDGFFSFEAKGLSTGSHSLYVMSDQGAVSDSITISIDTLPPVASSLTLTPDGVLEPGQSVSVAIQSEPDLEKASVRVQGAEVLLSATGQPGHYTGNFVAPTTTGNFPLDVILVDAFANKAELLNQRTLQIADSTSDTPPMVTGVSGEAGDGQVDLTWQPALDHHLPIAHYRVYFGSDFNQLNQVVDTTGPSASATVFDLQNDVPTFFSVRAVDSQGVESGEGSLVISVTPKKSLSTPASSGYVATPMNSAVSLSWPTFPGVQAFYYKVYFGVQSRQYDDFVVTRDHRPESVIADLINETPYYFAVTALDIHGNEISTFSPEFSAVPSATALRPAASFNTQLKAVPSHEKTGAEALWIVLISAFAAYSFYLFRRRVFSV